MLHKVIEAARLLLQGSESFSLKENNHSDWVIMWEAKPKLYGCDCDITIEFPDEVKEEIINVIPNTAEVALSQVVEKVMGAGNHGLYNRSVTDDKFTLVTGLDPITLTIQGTIEHANQAGMI